MAKRSDAEYAQMSDDVERGDFTVIAAQREYNNSPELRELLREAMNSPTVFRKRRRRVL